MVKADWAKDLEIEQGANCLVARILFGKHWPVDSRHGPYLQGAFVLKTPTFRYTTTALALALLAGCAQSPIPVSGNFDLTEQKKVRSAGHWQVLSRDAVRETLKMLDDAGVVSNARLTVASPEKSTTFDRTFHELLTTELVRSGRRVTTSGQNPLQLSYNAQIVIHNSHRPHFIPGIHTMLAGGIFALYGLRNYHLDTQALGLLGVTSAIDYAASVGSGGPTHTELVLTTTVSTPDQILTRKTNVYYLEDVDVTLFTHPPEYKRMRVVNCLEASSCN